MIKTKIALITGSGGLVGIESVKFFSNDFDLMIGKTRFKVERTFGGMKRWFSGGVSKYRGITKMHTQNLMEAMCYNLYRSPGIIASNCEK
jgi:IS5 family transposase